MSRRAVITGITGQDGSYLADLLLEKGYEVVGVTRRLSAPNRERIEHLGGRVDLRQADLLDQMSLLNLVDEVRPHELYNLAAMSFVPASWEQPLLTAEYNALGVTRILDAIRRVDALDPVLPGVVERDVRQGAGDAPDRGDAVPSPQPLRGGQGVRPLHHRELSRELRPVRGVGHSFQPRVAPARAGVRDAEDHATRWRGSARGLGEGAVGSGTSSSRRDWGFAGDYVRAMWAMLQQDAPRDYVVATGVSRSVGELVETAFGHAGLDWRQHVRTDPGLLRPAEVDHLIGDASRARAELGWSPAVGFKRLIGMMVDADLARHRAGSPALAVEVSTP